MHVVDSHPGAAYLMDDLDVIERELTNHGGLEDLPGLVALNKIDVPDGRGISDIVIDDLRERGLRVFPVSAASGEGLRELTFAMAELVANARAATPAAEATRIVLRPPSADGGDDFTVSRTDDGGWRVRETEARAWSLRLQQRRGRRASSANCSTGSGSRRSC